MKIHHPFRADIDDAAICPLVERLWNESFSRAYNDCMFDRSARTCFDQAAKAYDAARPGYPRELIDQLAELAKLRPDARILEIGCGTGQITRALARRGYEIVAIELGENLAQMAADNLAGYPNVRIIHSPFEEWIPEESGFDMVLSAQALHWIDPGIGYPKIRQLLAKRGHLAVIYNLFTGGAGPIYDDLARVYHRYFPEKNAQSPRTSLRTNVDRTLRMIKESRQFRDPIMWSHPWSKTYTTDRHIQLLESFSDHRRLEASVRAALFREVRTAIDAHGGIIERPLQATLFLAQVA